MRKLIFLLLFVNIVSQKSLGQINTLPASIYSGKQGHFHVQGVAVDQANGFVYFSFTDRLVKTDLSGKLIGSVTGFVGHLGDLDISEEGNIYASLEYKNDAIGKGIKKELGIKANDGDGFYIALFNAAAITKPDMNADKENLLRTVYIKEAVDDYNAKVKHGQEEKLHRFGCSGIDGLTLAPAIGASKSSKKFLYVAYGIYGDSSRNDNDHQVILKYDVADLNKYATKLAQGNLHQSGPQKPLDKYFVKTGNTRYGIQNLAYDGYSGNLYAAVYKGAKPQFANYDLFIIDGKQKPLKQTILSDNHEISIKTLSLLNANKDDAKLNPKGWFFPWGATGLCPLGNGEFYISHDNKIDDMQESTIYKYKWTGDSEQPFTLLAN